MAAVALHVEVDQRPELDRLADPRLEQPADEVRHHHLQLERPDLEADLVLMDLQQRAFDARDHGGLLRDAGVVQPPSAVPIGRTAEVAMQSRSRSSAGCSRRS